MEGALHRLRPKLMTVFVVIPSLAPINSARRSLIRRKNGGNITAVLDQSEAKSIQLRDAHSRGVGQVVEKQLA
jgi:hypothetical protein